jgi:hypothetical protein
VLSPLLSDPSALVRHALVRVMPAPWVTDLTLDPDPRVARTAYLSGLPAERDQVFRLTRSQHPHVRAMAQADERLGRPQLTNIRARLTTRTQMASDRNAFTAALRNQLLSPNVAGTLEALAKVRALALAHEFEGQLMELCDTGVTARSERVTATAVALLAHGLNPRAADIARALTEHPDHRVRANAVETLARLERRGISVRSQTTIPFQLLELKDDDHHRVRANALRAAITGRTGDDAEELARMLSDQRPMHRLAGLWLAGRVLHTRSYLGERWPEFLARVGEIARFDEEPQVRARAIACAATLQTQLRASWTAVGGGRSREVDDSGVST